ncbi:glycosyltransferase family 2 protein [Halalkalibacterium halodurans]|uniref:glycosyltransferase family 2 protein n=1 Tax=Halalkalibacterium halodurans TaxID=86665 RepID=UPI002E1B7007|nr:glycosyltransferase family 2 protein [Halalkalibacterium halodurans]MED4083729.1 glycosyltransferase family 2 protein [Halalkalibacterium halodurans]MED4106582.1 glycosyltransferase family 2 protein [Halalkalibacterium halodurans]MED4109570.1 glycosyltransferase family 2 protein [Halalkalibacterium halodurans]MED4150954.1 glycosyltransferase family 2 protein [Halalkalibacterium halodurans]
MESILMVVFVISSFVILWAMIGYPFSLKILKFIFKNKKLDKNFNYIPNVTVMVVAHNEEKVIYNKLKNIIKLNYPDDKIEFLVASDNSTDKTNEIVSNFIRENPSYNIRLYEVNDRKGKTNAQNEAQKTVKSEILVMTDANSMMEADSVKELVSVFTTEDVSYVSGRLVIINQDSSDIASSENQYWDSDTKLREIESNLQTITAGNGAIYACRNDEYFDFDPIECHDIAMPTYYALQNKRAVYNPDAIAYEKAGETIEDEFKRKVRMNRSILRNILPDIKILNVFKYRWFTYFYLGHRTCRYLLWISHLVLFLSNIFIVTSYWVFMVAFIGQVLFYLLALIKAITKVENKYLTVIYYYCATLLAQWAGVYNIITGRAKPFWDKAESTR